MRIASIFITLLTATIAAAQPQDDPRVLLGLVSPDVLEGSQLFFNETFGGNGRTCGTCHLAESNLAVEQADVAGQPATSLFNGAGVAGLEQPNFIMQLLVLENVDGFTQPPMFRSVPHTLSLATSITSTVDVPAGTQTVGWGGDGAPAPGTLRDFATGAVRQHFPKTTARVEGVDFRLPTDAELDDMLAFQLSLGRTADIDLASVRFEDPLAESGRPFYLDSVNNNCQRCHGDAGASRGINGGGFERLGPDGAITGNQNKDTGVDTLRVMFAPHDDGRGVPGDETFSPPPLIEAADTGPWFHIGPPIADLESAVRFYTTANFTGARQTFGEDRVQALGAVLRSLNASLNAQMALQRIEAAQMVLLAGFSDHPSVAELLDLAAEEAEDGARVLRSPGTQKAKAKLSECEKWARKVSNMNKPAKHTQQIEMARSACVAANQQLGTGLTMELGAGNLAMRSSRFHSTHTEDDEPPSGPPNP